MIISSVRLCQLRQDAARQLLQPAAAFSGSKASPSAPTSATRADRSSKQRKPRTGGSERSTDGSKGTPDPAPASDSSVAAKAKQRLQSGRQRTSQALELGRSRGHPIALKQRQSPKLEPAAQLEQLQQERQRRQQQQQQQQAKQQGPQEQQGQKEAAQQDQGQRAGAGRKRWLRRRWRARQKAPDPGHQLADEQPPRSGGSRGASPQAEKSKLPFRQRQQQHGEQTVPQEQQKETDVIGAGHYQQLPVLVPLPQPREQQEQRQLAPRVQGSTAPSQDGMSQADYQRAPGAGSESGTSGIDAPTTGLHSREAAAQQREVGSAAAAAQADIVPKADRQQTRAFIRLRLEQLHHQQEQQRGAPGVGAPGSADMQDEAGTAVEAAGQRAQQQTQHTRQAQVGWAVEAAEVLCSLGMSPEEAAKTLQAAQAYSSRRRQAAPGPSSAGSSAEGGAAAGRAAPASEPGALPGPVTAAHAESVCRVLADEARIPVGRLRDVLARAPQLLGCTADDLRKQVGPAGCTLGCSAAAAHPCDAPACAPPHTHRCDAHTHSAPPIRPGPAGVRLALPRPGPPPPVLTCWPLLAWPSLTVRGAGAGVAAAPPPGPRHPWLPGHAGPRLPGAGEGRVCQADLLAGEPSLEGVLLDCHRWHALRPYLHGEPIQ